MGLLEKSKEFRNKQLLADDEITFSFDLPGLPEPQEPSFIKETLIELETSTKENKDKIKQEKRFQRAQTRTLRKKYKLDQKKIRSEKNSQKRVKMLNLVKLFFVNLFITISSLSISVIISILTGFFLTLFVFYLINYIR